MIGCDELRRETRVEDLRLDQRVHRPRRRLAVDGRDRRGVLEGGVVAQDRERAGDGLDRRWVAAEARGHEARDRRRPDGGDVACVDACRLALLEGRDELAHEQRVASGRAGALGAHRVRRRGAEAVPDQRGDGRGRERGRAHGRLALDQLGQGLRRRRGLTCPYGDDGTRRELLDPRLQVGEEPDRLRVRPVRVVDEQGERALLGQPRAQPVQAVEAREQAVVGGRPVGDLLEQRAREPRGARERAFTLAALEPLDARREQLDHHAEREVALHHAAARAEHRHPARLGQRGGLAHQRALADPGRTLDHQDPAGTGGGGAQRGADLLQLGLPLQQRGSRRARHVSARPSVRPGKAFGGVHVAKPEAPAVASPQRMNTERRRRWHPDRSLRCSPQGRSRRPRPHKPWTGALHPRATRRRPGWASAPWAAFAGGGSPNHGRPRPDWSPP